MVQIAHIVRVDIPVRDRDEAIAFYTRDPSGNRLMVVEDQ